MDKSSQSRSVGNIFSPLRYIGKKYLSSRSDIYKNTLNVIIKADDIFRDIARKQNNYLKYMKRDKGKLEAVKFAQDVHAFLREQAVMVEIAETIRDKFAEEVGINGDQLKNIDYYISSEIGRTPEYNPNQVVENKIDVEQQWEIERPSSIKRWLEGYIGQSDDYARLEPEEKTALEKNPELISEAFLASWFWGRTKSGKELKKAFDVVYNAMMGMFNTNLSTLKILDNLRSQGDPQSYWNAVKGKNGFGNNYKRFVESNNFQTAWSKFEDMMYQSMQGEPIVSEEKPIEEDKEDTEFGSVPSEYDEEQFGGD